MYKCTLPEEDGLTFSPVSFQRQYRDRKRPVVLRSATSVSSESFREQTRVSALTMNWGHANVTLSSANAFSYGRRKSLLSDYLSSMAAIDWSSPSDEVFYLFGEHGEELAGLLAQYNLPRFATSLNLLAGASCSAPAPALSFGVAADGSGVPFHFHNDGFSEVPLFHGLHR